jgi:hypothetical protein
VGNAAYALRIGACRSATPSDEEMQGRAIA